MFADFFLLFKALKILLGKTVSAKQQRLKKFLNLQDTKNKKTVIFKSIKIFLV